MRWVSALAKRLGTGKAKVLFFALDRHLLNSLEKALRRAGYEVECVSTGKEAMELIASIPFDLFIAGFRVPEHDRNQLASQFKKRNQKGRVIFLYSESIRKAEIADAVISIQSGPAELMLVIGEQLSRAEPHVER